MDEPRERGAKFFGALTSQIHLHRQSRYAYNLRWIMTQSNHHQLAREFFAALTNGEVPDSLLMPDMTMWSTSSPTWSTKARFQAGIKLLASVFNGGLHYTVDSITAEEDRIAAEVQARGTLINGETYQMRYVFMLRVHDGRIASVAEHNDPVPVRERLGPLMQAVMARAK